MPLVANRPGSLVLVCLNGCTAGDRPSKTAKGFHAIDPQHPGPAASTMHPARDWNALMAVDPPKTQPEGTAFPTQPYFYPQRGTPVQLYICSVCGYVELYAGVVVDESTWHH